MRFLRRLPTSRLLALCAAAAALAAGGTAIALAATGGGPTPPPKPLAQAVHDALSAPAVAGVTARVRFTNHLIDQASLGEGAAPILTGASGRLWAAPDGRVRLELQTDRGTGDTQVLLAGDRFTVLDAAGGTVYEGTLPAGHGTAHDAGPPSLSDIQHRLAELVRHADVSGAQPTDVAGRGAYTVRVGPKREGGLLGGAELAWDAANGVPLRAAVYAAGRTGPVLELEATDVSFGSVDPSVFDVKPSAGAKVVDLSPPGGGADAKPVTGASAVAAKLPFTLAAPDTLAGMPRSEVRLISSDEHPAALVTYGRGLGGLAVVESASKPADGSSSSSPEKSLPSVTIGAVQGQELATPLGTVVRFARGGVDYVVAGSVRPDVAEAAARAL